jgi:hypothetical protein
MTLTTEQVVNALIQMTAYPSVLSPLVETIAVKVPVTFSSVVSLQTFTGTFTPSNNQQNILTFSNGATAPNFLFILTDAQLNITVNQNNNSDTIFNAPIFKCLFYTQPVFSSGWISNIQLNGLTGSANPMPQGTPVNYTVVYGQATIS